MAEFHIHRKSWQARRW